MFHVVVGLCPKIITTNHPHSYSFLAFATARPTFPGVNRDLFVD